jgi:2-phosphoglycerate kinase
VPNDDIYIVSGRERIPFLRGMLTYHLLQKGMSFEEAYEIADTVRNMIHGQETIDESVLVSLIRRVVKERYGDRYGGDYIFWTASPSSIVVEGRQSSSPFSKGILSQSLQAAGLDPNIAYGVARDIETKLKEGKQTSITRNELRDLTLRTLVENHGNEYGERYLVWRRFQRLEKPLIILIGGTTGVGKTSIGIALAHSLGISRLISTDAIRQVMRLILAPELIPSIHYSSYEAWRGLTIPLPEDADPIIEAFREQAIRVCVGARAMIERALEENVNMILDGVHLVPGFIDLTPYRKKAHIVTSIVTTLDVERYKDRFASRALASANRPMHKYMKNLDAIITIQKYIIRMAELNRVPMIHNINFDEAVRAAIDLIIRFLQRQKEFKRETDVERVLSAAHP